MVRGLVAIVAMKKRLETRPPPISVSGDKVSSFATISRQPLYQRTKESGEGQGLEVHILEKNSPINSPKKKKLKNTGKDVADVLASSSLGYVLDKGFWAPDFMDRHLLNENTKLGLAKMPLEDTLPRVQRILLRSATYSLPFKRKKQTSLENEVRSLKKAQASSNLRAENLKKQVSELIRKIEKLELLVKKAECDVVDRVFNAEWNILDQIRLIAPDLDVSEVDAFKKIVVGKVVSIL
ncbi:hypothetical protein AHAS_Ahas12G0119700 [Arachis hypogaea]